MSQSLAISSPAEMCQIGASRNQRVMSPSSRLNRNMGQKPVIIIIIVNISCQYKQCGTRNQLANYYNPYFSLVLPVLYKIQILETYQTNQAYEWNAINPCRNFPGYLSTVKDFAFEKSSAKAPASTRTGRKRFILNSFLQNRMSLGFIYLIG